MLRKGYLSEAKFVLETLQNLVFYNKMKLKS